MFLVKELSDPGTIQDVDVFDAEVFWVAIEAFVAAGLFIVAVLVFADSEMIYVIPAVYDAAVGKFCSG